jgi:hypothetical protein
MDLALKSGSGHTKDQGLTGAVHRPDHDGGLWQVSGRSDVSYDERVWLDVEYARARSTSVYLIVLWPVPAALTGHGY